jgi:transmembrane protein DUF3566
VEPAGSSQPGSSDKPVPVIAPDDVTMDTVAMSPPVPRPERPSTNRPEPPAARPEQRAPAVSRAPIQVRRLRRGRLAIRKIDPWAVLKFSLVFYFCMLLIMMLATAIIFGTLKAFGVINNLQKVFENLGVNVNISGGLIFRWFFLIGIAGTIVASAITVFMAFLYNLIADVVGGIELLVTERE